MAKKLPEIVATNVKKYREEKGFTKTRLTNLCGWSNTDMIGKIENHSKSINLTTLEKIADALEVTVIDLVEDWED